jgi:hypothetical protein
MKHMKFSNVLLIVRWVHVFLCLSKMSHYVKCNKSFYYSVISSFTQAHSEEL